MIAHLHFSSKAESEFHNLGHQLAYQWFLSDRPISSEEWQTTEMEIGNCARTIVDTTMLHGAPKDHLAVRAELILEIANVIAAACRSRLAELSITVCNGGSA